MKQVSCLSQNLEGNFRQQQALRTLTFSFLPRYINMMNQDPVFLSPEHQPDTQKSSCTPQTLTFTFSEDDPFYKNHFQGFPVVPGSLIMEAFLQTIEKNENGSFPLQVKRFQFKRFTMPCQAEAKITRQKNQWHCELFQKGVLTAKGIILQENKE